MPETEKPQRSAPPYTTDVLSVVKVVIIIIINHMITVVVIIIVIQEMIPKKYNDIPSYPLRIMHFRLGDTYEPTGGQTDKHLKKSVPATTRSVTQEVQAK